MLKRLTLLSMFLCCVTAWGQNTLPWKNGKLVVSDENRYLKHENGKPLFGLGDTGWLMQERLNRDEVDSYLQSCKNAGYNVV